MRVGICEWTTFSAPFEDELRSGQLPTEEIARRAVEAVNGL